MKVRAVQYAWIACALAGLVSTGCRGNSEHSPGAKLLSECLELADGSGEPVALFTCLGTLHTRPDCSAAWKAAALPFDHARVLQVLTACADNYCGNLPSPRPRVCSLGKKLDTPLVLVDLIELTTVILDSDAGLSGSKLLLGRVAGWLAMAAADTTNSPPAVAQPIAKVADEAAGTGAATATGTVGEQAIAVELPTSDSATAATTMTEVAVDAAGKVTVGQRPLADNELSALLAERVAADPALGVVVVADRGVAHGRVMALLSLLRTAGVKRYALQVTDKP